MFSQDEVQLISDALDALETKQSSSELMTLMMGGLLIRDDDTRQEFIDESKSRMENPGQDQEVLKERIILLKAKLIQMKDKAVAEDFELWQTEN